MHHHVILAHAHGLLGLIFCWILIDSFTLTLVAFFIIVLGHSSLFCQSKYFEGVESANKVVSIYVGHVGSSQGQRCPHLEVAIIRDNPHAPQASQGSQLETTAQKNSIIWQSWRQQACIKQSIAEESIHLYEWFEYVKTDQVNQDDPKHITNTQHQCHNINKKNTVPLKIIGRGN